MGNNQHCDQPSQPEPATRPGGTTWSHALLQRGERSIPLKDDPDALANLQQLEELKRWLRQHHKHASADRAGKAISLRLAALDRTDRPISLRLPLSSNGWLLLPSPRPTDIGLWLDPGAHDDHDLAPSQQRYREAIYTALCRLGRNNADDNERALLLDMLEHGLNERVGHQLITPELTFYHYLHAAGLRARTHRVCEICHIVHRSKRAWRCPSCRHNPPRIRKLPWHLETRPRDPAAHTRTTLRTTTDATGSTLTVIRSGHRGCNRTTYLTHCSECDVEFTTPNAQRRYCPACATPAARVARHRRRTQPGS